MKSSSAPIEIAGIEALEMEADHVGTRVVDLELVLGRPPENSCGLVDLGGVRVRVLVAEGN